MLTVGLLAVVVLWILTKAYPKNMAIVLGYFLATLVFTLIAFSSGLPFFEGFSLALSLPLCVGVVHGVVDAIRNPGKYPL